MFKNFSKYLPKICLWTFTLIITVIIIGPKSLIYAEDVTLVWTGNTEPDLAGYFIYYKSGTSGAPYNGTGVDEGDSPIKIPLGDFADPENPEYTLHGLSDIEISYLVVSAYDSEDNESSFSNEVSSLDLQPENFVDVTPGYWAEAAIYKIYNAGITKGCSQNTLMFCPNTVTTRAQMATFLVRGIHGSNFTPPTATGIFWDVPWDYWAAEWIEQAYNDGITKGCNTDPLLYCPTVYVTRAQMAVFLLRAKHGDSYTPPAASGIFSDVDLNHWAADWIEQLYNEGITVGCGTDPLRYCPDASVTRAQMAVFLMRTFDL